MVKLKSGLLVNTSMDPYTENIKQWKQQIIYRITKQISKMVLNSE